MSLSPTEETARTTHKVVMSLFKLPIESKTAKMAASLHEIATKLAPTVTVVSSQLFAQALKYKNRVRSIYNNYMCTCKM